DQAGAVLDRWGLPYLVDDPYNVCNRLLAAQQRLPEQPYSVRFVAMWKHGDLSYVDRMVADMAARPCDLVTVPKDFDVTMAADVASLDAMRRIGAVSGTSPEMSRARFNPWGYMEMHPVLFAVRHLEPAPSYDDERSAAILAERRRHPENEYFGRD